VQKVVQTGKKAEKLSENVLKSSENLLESIQIREKG